MTLIDTAAAAVAIGVTERTVRRMVLRGQLANHGTARAIKVALEECVDVCTSRSVSATL